MRGEKLLLTNSCLHVYVGTNNDYNYHMHRANATTDVKNDVAR
jgi:hypothetical protein